mmetsp:Transcript_65757/g.140677  ORF Transcript_65757/g.140677 Transcript_65757/m.140677 type:complete len:207 (-) Transcript_65757:114-734(-)
MLVVKHAGLAVGECRDSDCRPLWFPHRRGCAGPYCVGEGAAQPQGRPLALGHSWRRSCLRDGGRRLSDRGLRLVGGVLCLHRRRDGLREICGRDCAHVDMDTRLLQQHALATNGDVVFAFDWKSEVPHNGMEPRCCSCCGNVLRRGHRHIIRRLQLAKTSVRHQLHRGGGGVQAPDGADKRCHLDSAFQRPGACRPWHLHRCGLHV